MIELRGNMVSILIYYLDITYIPKKRSLDLCIQTNV